ncbi:MAG: hypothetical protein SH821_02450 [Phototrophicales bacterium]|nr:hypothetical protein [Phototrophicales bacterium]
MKTKDIVYIVGGLILGIVVGVVIATVIGGGNSGVTEDQVRSIVNDAVSNQGVSPSADDIVQAVITTLRGPNAPASNSVTTAGQTRDVNSTFFLVPIEEAGSWLETVEKIEFDAEVTTENLELLYNDITSESQLALYFTLPERVTTVNSVLSVVYNAMLTTVGVAPEEAMVQGEATAPSYVVCLGLDNDPYSLSGPLLYFYMQLPNDVAASQLLDAEGKLPTGWEQLDGPRENSMLWTAECYDPASDESAIE